jgi:acyl-coenzyme A thioesterase PaaI-like protein
VIDEKYRGAAERAVGAVEGIRRTGIRAVALRDRYAKMLMPLEGNVNHVGMMYAGSLFTLGEIAGGAIHLVSFDVTRLFPIVKEVHIRFRRPAMTDVTLEVELSAEEASRIQAEALEKGKADYVLNLELKGADGEVVAIVGGTWQVRVIPDGMWVATSGSQGDEAGDQPSTPITHDPKKVVCD